jgi:hypothetical protein
MVSSTMVSELSIANLPTSVTLRVSHSSMPKIASQKNQKNTSVPTIMDKILLSQLLMDIILLVRVILLMVINGSLYGY